MEGYAIIIMSQGGFGQDYTSAAAAAGIVKTLKTGLNVYRLRSAIRASMLGQSQLKRYMRLITAFGANTAAQVPRYCFDRAFIFALKDYLQRLFNSSVLKGSAQWYSNNAIAGGLAGLIFNFIIYPYDNLKVRTSQLRMMIKLAHPDAVPNFTVLETFKHVKRTEGFWSLYRGIGVRSCSILVYRSMLFGNYDSLKPMFGRSKDYFLCFLLGTVVSIASIAISEPIRTIEKAQNLYVPINRSMFVNGLKSRWDNEGLRLFAKGWEGTVYRGIFGGMILVLYDWFKAHPLTENLQL